MARKPFVLAIWDDTFGNIKHSGVYPRDTERELLKKLKSMKLHKKIKSYKTSYVDSLF